MQNYWGTTWELLGTYLEMMKQNPSQFAQMLTEAVYAIRLEECKSLQIIHDEIGYAIGRQGGRTIEYWRQGNIPGKRSDVEKLTHELVRRGQFNKEWTEQFLAASGFQYTPELHNKLFSSHLSSEKVNDVALPHKTYRQLIGREALQKKSMAVLADSDGGWIVGIDGMGGIGKTALALNLIEQCQQQNRFHHVVWLSAAVTSEGKDRQENADFSFESILNGIGLQLGVPEVSGLSLEKKKERVQIILAKTPILLVLDNLETAVSPQEEIIQQLQPLLSPSKALLTSRKRFAGDLYAIHLKGLDTEQSTAFIQQDAQEKGIAHLQQIDPEDVEAIVTTTGGSPLALKLVVSQLAYLPLDIVLQNLQTVSTLQLANLEGEYFRFYKHVFFRSWNLLDEAGKQLLVAMAHFGTDNGTPFAAIQHTSDLPQITLIKSIDHLWRLSLLEIGEGQSLRQIRYFLHPLTQHFVLSDIVKVI